MNWKRASVVLCAIVAIGSAIKWITYLRSTAHQWPKLVERRQTGFTMRIVSDALQLREFVGISHLRPVAAIPPQSPANVPFTRNDYGELLEEDHSISNGTWILDASYQGYSQEPRAVRLGIWLNLERYRKSLGTSKKGQFMDFTRDRTRLFDKNLQVISYGDLTVSYGEITDGYRHLIVETPWPPKLIPTTPIYPQRNEEQFYCRDRAKIDKFLGNKVLRKGVSCLYVLPLFNSPDAVPDLPLGVTQGYLMKDKTILALLDINKVYSTSSGRAAFNIDISFKGFVKDCINDEIAAKLQGSQSEELFKGITAMVLEHKLSICISPDYALDSMEKLSLD